MRYIHVKVIAGVKKESFLQKNDDHFEISVREEAERNMANTRVLEILAEALGVTKNKIRIVNGHHSPSKLIVIED